MSFILERKRQYIITADFVDSDFVKTVLSGNKGLINKYLDVKFMNDRTEWWVKVVLNENDDFVNDQGEIIIDNNGRIINAGKDTFDIKTKYDNHPFWVNYQYNIFAHFHCYTNPDGSCSPIPRNLFVS